MATVTARAERPPAVMLWAWERPEDLRGLPETMGVAVLWATVRVGPRGVTVSRRRQPLRVTERSFVMPVVRVELERGYRSLSVAERLSVVRVLCDAERAVGHGAVQIDFDAPRSLRGAYALLLGEARRALGREAWFSMTALASWCEGDGWLGDAHSVNEVVPMVFDMGTDARGVLDALRSRRRFREARCQSSVGWSVGQPTVELRGVSRTYVFNPRPWRPEELARWVRGE